MRFDRLLDMVFLLKTFLINSARKFSFIKVHYVVEKGVAGAESFRTRSTLVQVESRVEAPVDVQGDPSGKGLPLLPLAHVVLHPLAVQPYTGGHDSVYLIYPRLVGGRDPWSCIGCDHFFRMHPDSMFAKLMLRTS